MKCAFDAALEGVGPGEAWVRLQLPIDVEKEFGSKGRLAMRGTINGYALRTSIFPNGDGTHHMMVNKTMRQGAGAAVGDVVHVEMDADAGTDDVAIPDDLVTALDAHEGAAEQWSNFTPAKKREYVAWIEGAKRAPTRASRVAKALDMIAAGKRQTDM
jgi:hypothetical protein